MQRMPNIKLTREEYDIMANYCRFNSGGEGIIFKSQRPNTLYKVFVDYETTTPVGMSDNKYQKVLSLYERQLQGGTQPLSTISLDGELIGYEMTYDEDDESLDKIILPRRQLIVCLKQASEILKYYASEDITYGDVKSNNILVNRRTHQVKFCDMDNIRLGEHQIDLLNDYVDSFITCSADIDASVDAYMHNLMTLQFLNAPTLDYDQILYNLSEGKYQRSYKKEAKPTLETMASSEPFTGEYIIQYVKR